MGWKFFIKHCKDGQNIFFIRKSIFWWQTKAYYLPFPTVYYTCRYNKQYCHNMQINTEIRWLRRLFCIPIRSIAYCGKTIYCIGMYDTSRNRGDRKLSFDTKKLTYFKKKFFGPKNTKGVSSGFFLAQKTFF